MLIMAMAAVAVGIPNTALESVAAVDADRHRVRSLTILNVGGGWL